MTCALITGGRDFADYAWGYDCLDAIHAEHRLRLLVIGLDPKKRKGVDWMGYEWAENQRLRAVLEDGCDLGLAPDECREALSKCKPRE